MECWYPVKGENLRRTVEYSQSKAGKPEAKTSMSVIKIDPYKQTESPTQNITKSSASKSGSDVLNPSVSFNLSAKKFNDRSRCLHYNQKRGTHQACVDSKTESVCKHSYFDESSFNLLKILENMKRKTHGLDIGMFMDDELVDDIEQIYSKGRVKSGYPEYDIYVRNTGSHPLYFSVPLTEKSKLYLAEDEEIRSDLYDQLISNNVYKSIEPNSGWVKVFSYNKEMCQLLDKLISEKWETKLKENSKKLNHSSLNEYAKCNLLLPWNFNARQGSKKKALIKTPILTLERSNLLGENYFILANEKLLLELEYISITCLKTTGFINDMVTTLVRKYAEPLSNTDSTSQQKH